MTTPTIKTPAGISGPHAEQKPADLDDLDLPPEKRELILYREIKAEHSKLTVEHRNAQRLLRELYQLRREKFASFMLALISTIFVSFGWWVESGRCSFIPEGWGQPVGFTLVFVGIVTGVFVPLIEKILWAWFHRHKAELICPQCNATVVHKD